MDQSKTLDRTQYHELDMPPRILLGPGPSMVDPRVLRAMATPVVGHLDPSYLKVMDAIQVLLRYTFRTENSLTLPITGSGSAAMEAALANTIQPDDEVLICANGFFGMRMAEIAARYGGQVRTLRKPWGTIFTPGDVKEALREHPAKVVGIVHGETSSGALQPVDEIAKVVHQHNGLLIVDAVCTLGGVPLDVDAFEIDVCYSGSQKCLSCPPGLGPITVGPRAEEFLAGRKSPPTSWYLDLSLLKKYWGPERVYHHTGPISANYSLYEALRIVAEEGLENRWDRHQHNAEMLWEGLHEIGLEPFVPVEHRLASLTTVKVPDGVDEALIRRRLLEEYNIEIAGGLGELKGKVWRVGLMGFSSRPENIILFLDAIKRLLSR
jgi:alanine-glyoxylate transaminase/serine-glyoxylate transaminase/serine-pyruvate transaminase